jgi:type I restriction enzyme S subunit
VRRHELPVPPLQEQRRIVQALEEHLTRLEEAEAQLERVQRNLKRYRASVLQAAVEGRLVPTEAELARAKGRDYEPADVLLTRILAERRHRWHETRGRGKYREPVAQDTSGLPELPEGWCWATVDAVGEVLLGRRRAPEYRGELRPYLRLANVRDDRIDHDQIKRMPFDQSHAEHYLLRPGDILVSEGQSPERQLGSGAWR